MARHGSNGFDALAGADGVDTVVFAGSVYALVTSSTADTVQLVDVTNPALPTAVGSISAGAALLDSPKGVDTFMVGNSLYAIVAAQNDNGVQIMRVAVSAALSASKAHALVNGSGVVIIPTEHRFDSIEGGYSVSGGAFRSNAALVSLDTGSTVVAVGDYAAKDTTALTSVVLGDSVETVGDNAFEGASSLVSVESAVQYRALAQMRSKGRHSRQLLYHRLSRR